MKATKEAGNGGWLLWNAGSKYKEAFLNYPQVASSTSQ
jgi:hypothetical protein